MRYISKIFLITLLIILILLGLSILSVSIFLNTEKGQEFLSSTVERELEKILNMNVSVDKIKTDIFSGIKIENLKIFKQKDKEIIPFVESGSVEVLYNIFSIIHYEFEIKNIAIKKLGFAVLIDSTGVYNFPETGGKESPEEEKVKEGKTGFGFRVNKITVEDGSFLYSDSGIPMEFKSVGIDISADYSINGAFSFKLESPETSTQITDIKAPVRNLILDGSWESGDLDLKKISFKTLDMDLSGSLKLHFGEQSPVMDAGFIIKGNPEMLASTFMDSSGYGLLPVDGVLTAENKISGPLNKLVIDSDITSERIALNDKIFEDFSSTLKFSDNILSLISLNFESLGGKISATGNIYADSLLNHQLKLTADGLNILEIRKMLKIANVNLNGNITASVSSEGSIKSPESMKIDANIIMSELVNNKVKTPDIVSTVNFNMGNIDAELTHAESHAKFQGSLKNDYLTGTLEANFPEISHLAELAGVKNLSGAAGLTLSINGKINSPEVSAELISHSIKYMDFPVDTLTGHITMGDNGIYLEKINISGNLKPDDKRPFGLPEIKGGIVYSANVSGTPDNLKAVLDADMQNPGYGNTVFESAKLSLTAEGEKFALQSQIIPKDSSPLNINGGYFLKSKSGDFAISIEDGGGITGNFEIPDFDNISVTANGQDIVLEKITKLVNSNYLAEGNFNFSLDVKQNKGVPGGSIDFDANSLKFQEARIDSVRGRVELKDNVIVLSPFNAFLDGNMASAQGMIQLSKSGGIDKTSYSSGEVSLKEMDLSILSPFLGDIQLYGGFSLTGEWKGLLEKPTFNGALNIADASIRKTDKPFIVQKLNASLSFSDTVLVIENVSGIFSGSPVEMTGRVSAPGWKKINGELNAKVADSGGLSIKGTYSEGSIDAIMNADNFNLSALEGIVPKVSNLKGTMISEIDITGPVKSPKIIGKLNLSGFGFKPDIFKTPFTEGNVFIRFDRENVYLDSLSIKKDKAYGTASGFVSMNKGQISDMDFSAIVKNFAINRPEYLANVDSMNVRYSKTDRGYLLNGIVNLGETKYRDNIRPKDIISMIKKQERPQGDIPDILLETRFDVRITGGDNIWIDNNLAKIRLLPRLQLVGSPTRPNVTGRLTAEEGYMLYFDREFKIENAILDFADPNKINPIIDLKSSTEVTGSDGNEFTINLNITGPLETAKLEITSTPALDQADILSLLTIGATRSQLMASGEQGHEAGGLLKERLEQLSSGTLSNYVTGNVGRSLGLESLSVEGNLFNFGESWGPRLVASEKISDRLEITYSTNVGELNQQGVSLDYSLTKNFAVSGYTNQMGNSGLDLKFKMKFR